MADTTYLVRRAAGAATLVVGLALLAGCGGGSSSTTTTGGVSSTQAARGPSDLAANLAWLVKKDHEELENFKAHCPAQPTPPVFPVTCQVTAIDTSTDKAPLSPGPAHHPVAGTATISGISPYGTYAYSLGLDARSR